MAQMMTPGVSIESAFPDSVVEVSTAVPAFVGYTEKASNTGKSLRNVPWRISSMAEYHQYFGFRPTPMFELVEVPEGLGDGQVLSLQGGDYLLNRTDRGYLLFYSLLLFFHNGGGPCYIVSVGGYEEDIDPFKLGRGVDALANVREPTMVLVPETVRLTETDSIAVHKTALEHCGGTMRNRIAILDVRDGFRDRGDPAGDCIARFRSAIGDEHLAFGTAYYPWLETTIVNERDIGCESLADRQVVRSLIRNELELPESVAEVLETDSPAERARKTRIAAQLDAIDCIERAWVGMNEKELSSRKSLLENTLRSTSRVYAELIAEMQRQLNLLPPSAAMAGVYTMVDNTRGVWKAPANVGLNAVSAPAVSIAHDQLEDLNVGRQGKSINVIRSFRGEAVQVWGARTLDGKSLDWRYVNVRRTMIMIEESIRLAVRAFVFEPNSAITWASVRGLIHNFLTGVWKRGGLAGAVPEDAFSVRLGLDETMTPQDIVQGILRVTVLVALTRPAEFFEIRIQQPLQES